MTTKIDNAVADCNRWAVHALRDGKRELLVLCPGRAAAGHAWRGLREHLPESLLTSVNTADRRFVFTAGQRIFIRSFEIPIEHMAGIHIDALYWFAYDTGLIPEEWLAWAARLQLQPAAIPG